MVSKWNNMGTLYLFPDKRYIDIQYITNLKLITSALHLDVAIAVHHQTVAAKMVLHIKMHYYSIVVIHTCVAAVEEDGGNVVIVVDEI